MQQTIDTMRLLLAVCVRRYGVFDQLTLPLADIEAVKEGDLRVIDSPDGIVLRIKGLPPRLVIHG